MFQYKAGEKPQYLKIGIKLAHEKSSTEAFNLRPHRRTCIPGRKRPSVGKIPSNIKFSSLSKSEFTEQHVQQIHQHKLMASFVTFCSDMMQVQVYSLHLTQLALPPPLFPRSESTLMYTFLGIVVRLLFPVTFYLIAVRYFCHSALRQRQALSCFGAPHWRRY